MCDGNVSGGAYGSSLRFSGLRVYQISVADGITDLGGVPHHTPESARSEVTCSNWWTNPNSVVKRSVFMSGEEDDFVYSVALDKVLVSSMDDLAQPLAEVDLLEAFEAPVIASEARRSRLRAPSRRRR